jgi:hypothetical protein
MCIINPVVAKDFNDKEIRIRAKSMTLHMDDFIRKSIK